MYPCEFVNPASILGISGLYEAVFANIVPLVEIDAIVEFAAEPAPLSLQYGQDPVEKDNLSLVPER